MSRQSIEYVTLQGIEVVSIRGMSIMIRHPEGRIINIGRTTLHFMTDDRLDEYNNKRIPLPVTMSNFRIMKWLAAKEGLIPNERNDDTDDDGAGLLREVE